MERIKELARQLAERFGTADPFDILPAVWLTSLLSVLAGLLAAKLFAHFWRN